MCRSSKWECCKRRIGRSDHRAIGRSENSDDSMARTPDGPIPRCCMSEAVKLIECPRDAWQGIKGQIPAELKTNYLQALISAGFKHIDAVSFVSQNAVPQMADSEAVLKELDPPDDVEIIGIVVNEKGAQRAIATNAVRTLGFPYSISPTFLQNNQRQTLEDAIEELEKIEKKADDAGLDTVVYISMAFGNPYGDLWTVDEVVEAVGLLELQEIRMI